MAVVLFLNTQGFAQRYDENIVYHTLKNWNIHKKIYTKLEFGAEIIYKTGIATGHVLAFN